MSSTWNITLVLFGVFGVIAVHSLVSLILASRRPKGFPPGPSPLPILGNLTQIPTTKSFLKFHDLSRPYGPMVGLKLGPQNLIILNDYKPVLDLFDRKGQIYSSRPPNHVATDLLFPNNVHALFMPSNAHYRTLRKTLQDLLRTSSVDKLLPLQNAESIQTLHDLLHDPNRWYDHIRRYSTAVILASVFGLRGATFDSARVRKLYHVQNQNTAINELGATPPVDIFPFLKYLPDFVSPWRKWARSIRREYRGMLWALVRESREKGAQGCFFHRLEGERMEGRSALTEEQLAYVGTTLMEAGSDTTASTLLSFLLAMVTHPEALNECQDEVDKRCGVRRSPAADDIEHLPYIRACMQETLRWRPVAAGGIPHAVTQDDQYNGYSIPKGTILFANAWSVHRSEEFADPDHFVPERFLANKFGTKSDVKGNDEGRRVLYGFGAGRRVCSGQRLAENSLMMNMAKLVWAFSFTAPSNTKVDDSVETGYVGGFLICPKVFPLDIVVRSKEHAEVIERELKEVQPFLDTFGGE